MLARWQFGITTVYHFLFVPLTIGLAFSVAGLQTAWHRTGDERVPAADPVLRRAVPDQLRAGRGHRHRAGVPVRHELERVQPVRGRHLRRAAGDRGPAGASSSSPRSWACGSSAGAACRSGPTSPRSGSPPSAPRSRRTSSWPPTAGCSTRSATWCNPVHGPRRADGLRRRVLTNSTALITFAHTIPAAFMTTGAFLAGISLWRVLRDQTAPSRRRSARPRKAGAIMVLVSGLLVAVTGDIQGKVMTEQQPMKMAAAEALWETEQPASFSIFTIGDARMDRKDVFSIRIPYLLSFLATGDFTAGSRASTTSRRKEEARFGPGDYTPNTPVTYWTFRLDDRRRDPGGARGRLVPVRHARGGSVTRAPSAWRSLLARSCRSRRTPSPGCSPRSDASPGSCSA